MVAQSTPPPPPVVRAHIAVNIRRLRKAKELSQEKLGELAGFHRTYVSQLERCKTNISVDRLEELAHVLGVEVIDLMQPPDEDAAAPEPARPRKGKKKKSA